VNIHECQAKGLLREYGVAVPPLGVATTPAEAEEVARGLTKGVVVVEAPGATWITASPSAIVRLQDCRSRRAKAIISHASATRSPTVPISKDFPEDPP
jgi:acyl-CoA synthetase (NDP forming)